jgi:hypothetical protein
MKQGMLEKIKWVFIFWLARRLPDCKTITPKFGESLDHKLPFKTRLTLKLHLLTCDACARYLKQIKYLSEAMHAQEERLISEDEISSPKLSANVKEALKEKIRLQMLPGNASKSVSQPS